MLWQCLLGFTAAQSQISSHQIFDRSNGLPAMHITDLEQDSRGFLWVATSGGGVVIYNGRDFQAPKTSSPLPRYIHRLLAIEDEVWIGAESGLVRLERNGSQYIVTARLKVGQVVEIERPDMQSLLICTAKGLLQVDRSSLEIIRLSGSPTACSCLTQQGARIWTASGSSLFMFENNAWKGIGEAWSLPEGRLVDIYLDDRNRLWVAVAGVGVAQLVDDAFMILAVPGKSISRNPTFLGSAGNRLIIGTSDQGIQIYDPSTNALEESNAAEIANVHVTEFLEDVDQYQWLATQRSGLIRKQEGSTQWIDQKDGLAESEVIHLQSDEKGIWAVGSSGSIDLIADGRVDRRYPEKFGMHDITCWSGALEESRWLGTSNGLLEVTDSVIFLHDKFDGQPIGAIKAMTAIGDTNLVIAAVNGLFEIARHDSNLSDSPPQIRRRLSTHPYLDLQQDGERIWCVGEREVTCYTGGIVKDVAFPAGVSRTVRPTCVTVSFDGEIMIGTRDHGLFRVQRDTLQAVDDYYVGGQIRSIIFDQDDHLWLSTAGEIIRYSERRANAVQRQTIWSRDQLATFSEFNYRSAGRDAQGFIYFGSNNGILQCGEEGLSGPIRAPRLFLDQVFVGDSTIRLDPERVMEIPAGVSLAFRPAMLDLSPNSDVQFEWILEGSPEPIWRTSNDLAVTFYQLTAGYYHLKMRGVNTWGARSQMVSAKFKILNPWWKEWWIPLAGIVLGIALVFAILQGSSKRMQKKMTIEKDALESQNHLLRLEQQALRAQMNPHFIFNVLQTIQSKVALGSKAEARSSIQSFSQLMRMYLEQSRSPSILLEDELRGLDLYLSLERETRDGAFDFEITVDPAVDVTTDKIPSMLIQPIVENAIKHGMPTGDLKGLIQVRMGYRGKNLQCEIRDNGRGFNLADRPKDSRSAGLEVTENRLKNYFRKGEEKPLQIMKRTFEQKVGTMARMIIPVLE